MATGVCFLVPLVLGSTLLAALGAAPAVALLLWPDFSSTIFCFLRTGSDGDDSVSGDSSGFERTVFGVLEAPLLLLPLAVDPS